MASKVICAFAGLLFLLGCGGSTEQRSINQAAPGSPGASTSSTFFVYAAGDDGAAQRLITFKADGKTGSLQLLGSISLPADSASAAGIMAGDPLNRMLIVHVDQHNVLPQLNLPFAINMNTGALTPLDIVIEDDPAVCLPCSSGMGRGFGLFDPQGRFFFFTHQRQPPASLSGISVYKINPDLSFTAIPGSPFGNELIPIEIAPDGKLFFARESGGSSGSPVIHTFSVAPTGELTEMATSEVPGSLWMHPSGKFMYNAYAVSTGLAVGEARLRVLNIDQATGKLTPGSFDILLAKIFGFSGGIPSSLSTDPAGKFLYTFFCEGAPNLPDTNCHNAGYEIAEDGALTRMAKDPPTVPFFDREGKFAYGFLPDRQLGLFHFDPDSGQLTFANSSSGVSFGLLTPPFIAR